MNDLSQGKYSHEKAMQLLKGHRKITFRYDILDKLERKITDLKKAEVTINFDSTQEIMGTAKVIMNKSDFQGIKSTDLRLVPWFCIFAEGEYLEYPLGIYILSSPTEEFTGYGVEYSCDCYDYNIILREDKVTERYYIPQNESYVGYIKKILLSAGVKKMMVEESGLIVKEDLEYDIGTSKLSIINELLTAINYEPIHFDSKGYAVSKRYVEPANRLSEHSYLCDEKSIIRDNPNCSMDVFNAPNVFVRYTNSPDGMEYKSQYINDSPTSALSTVNRGRNIVNIESIDNVADQETLDAITRRVAIEKSQVYETVNLNTALMPNHGYRDCVFLSIPDLEIGSRYIEYAWSMPLKIGGAMSHTLKKVIKL